MQNLIRSKSMGIGSTNPGPGTRDGNHGGRAHTTGTMAGASSTELHYGSRGLPASYRRLGDLGHYEPCPRTPRVQIIESVESTPDLEAREHRRHSIRRAARGADIEDMITLCERQCRKACNLRTPAEDTDEAGHSGSSGSKAWRYRKRGSPKPKEEEIAMETTRNPVRQWSAAESEGHSDGYRSALHSDYFSPELMATPHPLDIRAHTAPEPSLEHDVEALDRPARARTSPVARHTGLEPGRSGATPPTSTGERAHTAPVGSEAPPPPTMGARATTAPVLSAPAADLDSMGDTHMGEAEETREPRTTSCADSGVRHCECHCEHVSFLICNYPNIGKDVIVERLDRLTNQWYKFDETAAGILDNQTKLDKDVAGLRVEQAQYHENVRTAFCKQQEVIDSLLQLVNDMSGCLKGLEDTAERSSFTSGPELPAAPATAELMERVMTLRGPMEEVKPMDRPVESAPYAPLRVDPRVLPFVPMFSESTMLGERVPPAGSMREEHAVVDLRNPSRETAVAVRDPPTSMADAVYAEEEIHTMEARAKEGADGHGHGRGHPSGNLWVALL